MDQLILKYLIFTIAIFLINFLFTVFYTQLFKTILKSLKTGKIELKAFRSDGYFPSSHTANLISTNVLYWSYITIVLKKIYIVINLNDISYNNFNLIYILFSTIVCITALIGIILMIFTCYEIHNATHVRLRVQEQAEAIYKMLKAQIAFSLATENKEKILENFKEICVDYPSLHENDCNNIPHTLENTLSSLILKAGHQKHEVVGGIFIGVFIGSISSSIIYYNMNLTITFVLLLLSYTIGCILFFNRKNILKYLRKRR